jgi:signal transduction histidine kinase
MFGLRQKLLFGFGGLLVILLVVSGLGIGVLREHRAALDKFLYENWRSVQYGQIVLDGLSKVNDAAKPLSGDQGQPSTAAFVAATPIANKSLQDIDNNVTAEDANITLPGEGKIAANLTLLWSGYSIDIDSGQKLKKVTSDCYHDWYVKLLNPAISLVDRQAAYAAVARLSPGVKSAAQNVIDLNLANMTPVEGKIKDLSDGATRLMISLSVFGVGLAAILAALMSRSILAPLQTLIKSLREVEQGNLDLVVQVKSRDELRQLAEAFNSMAAKLREFRRTDRAKMMRIQRTTQLAVSSLPDAIAVVNAEGIIEISNETAQKLFQLNPGQSISAAPQRQLGLLYAQVVREGKSSQPKGYESALEVYDQGGQLKFFLPSAVPIADADQRLLGVTLVLGDVTNLRRLDEMKSGLLSVVSHELKTPLTSIRMATHLLLEERIGALNSKQTELLMAARDDADRLQKIIEELLDMGKLESGRVALDLRSEPAERLVSDAVTPLETAFHDRCLALEVDVPVETPPVLADVARIDHVFSNLLGNALKFTPPGGKVRIYAETEEQFVRFVVQDSGLGIPREYLGRIFERFYRVPRENQPNGAGLGLAIAKEIVDAHGGTISVESTPNEGSKFSFTLQRADLTPAANNANQLNKENEDQYETSLHSGNGR